MKKAELALALLISLVAVWLHVTRATVAGGLWRDEASAVQMALMPSISDIPKLLENEAFPILFSLTLRAYAAVAGASDMAFRMFGLAIGIGLLAVLFVCARQLTGGIPLISISLLGINAAVIQWADWTRGHGLGTVLILITFALIWRVVVSPSAALVSLATAAAIASVHTLYYNAVLLLAVGIAGAAVAARQKLWKRAGLVLAIGAVAAASLLPYLRIIERAGEWSHIFTIPEFSLGIFWSRLSEALSAAEGVAWVWLSLAAAAVAVAVVQQFQPGRRDAALYCLLVLVISVPAYFVFLKLLKYPTQPWYFIALIAVVAVSIDALIGLLPKRWWWSAARIVLACGIVLWSIVPTLNAIQIRQTNIDLVAATLAETSAAGDLIVVMPWYLGIPFERYYRGAAPWMTVPQISDHRLQRYDLFKAQMETAAPLAPLFEEMERTLRSGNRVWLVGQLIFPQPGQAPPVLAPAPDESAGWSEGAYLTSWMMQSMHFLQMHVWSAEEVPVPAERPINPHENAQLVVVRGWRGAAP